MYNGAASGGILDVVLAPGAEVGFLAALSDVDQREYGLNLTRCGI